MGYRDSLKPFLPPFARTAYHSLTTRRRHREELKQMTPSARRLYSLSQMKSYDSVRLHAETLQAIELTRSAARRIYGEQWNYYSDALRPEVTQSFEASIDELAREKEKIDYLEIGSCRGVSMSVIASILRLRSLLGSLTSLDPYFEDGYVEGEFGPYQEGIQVAVNKETRDSAFRLYSTLDLSVELREMTSLKGLKQFIPSGREFDLIYIDGSHEKLAPTLDFSLSYSVLRKGGIIMLDDHIWPDVARVKELCDGYGTKIHESWKVACYRFDGAI
ncbi:MAG TPA: class I SAM-dependent methyltransferase [Blastocatellia bacterium]|nr:class I SAM-dependent methyltransferase [Blastocatellia bacterium]